MSTQPHQRLSEPLIDLSQPRRCHVVGVGGPGMAPIAKLMAARGHSVSGSDIRGSQVIEQLRDLGVRITIGHDESTVHGADVVTYSTAIPATNVELTEARKLNIAVRHRSGMLASLCAVSQSVGVAGTHGKTTTTSLLSLMLIAGGLDPSVIVGAEVPDYSVGARAGAGEVLLLESDESDGTLDVLPLHAIVITNVDVDHLDYFGTFENVQSCFVNAAKRATGPVVVNLDDSGSAPIVKAMTGSSQLVTCGTGDSAMVRVQKFQNTATGLEMEIVVNGEMIRGHIPLRGAHNVMNCTAALAMAVSLGVDPRTAMDAVQSFGGVSRRFTERGVCDGALLVDDYAHLPAEIEAALSTARIHPARSGRVVAVFQPNRFHRIAAMAHTYSDCFHDADMVVITDVYASGTEPIEGVTGELVSNAISAAHPELPVHYAPTRSDIVTRVGAFLKPGDICVSMGCGDIETFPDDLMRARS